MKLTATQKTEYFSQLVKIISWKAGEYSGEKIIHKDSNSDGYVIFKDYIEKEGSIIVYAPKKEKNFKVSRLGWYLWKPYMTSQTTKKGADIDLVNQFIEAIKTLGVENATEDYYQIKEEIGKVVLDLLYGSHRQEFTKKGETK